LKECFEFVASIHIACCTIDKFFFQTAFAKFTHVGAIEELPIIGTATVTIDMLSLDIRLVSF
jgi:hypothetical protein